jgi:hypothetical protein
VPAVASVDRTGDEMESALRRLLAVTGASFERRAQLEHALETRIVIEQAKGILSERLQMSLDDAFEVLRTTARRERRSVHELARAVVEEPETPGVLLSALHPAPVRRPSQRRDVRGPVEKPGEAAGPAEGLDRHV